MEQSTLLVTTDATLRRDLKRSLAVRGIDRGMTLGDLVAALQLLGVTLHTPIDSIEVGVAQVGTGRIVVEWEQGAASIKEGVGR